MTPWPLPAVPNEDDPTPLTHGDAVGRHPGEQSSQPSPFRQVVGVVAAKGKANSEPRPVEAEPVAAPADLLGGRVVEQRHVGAVNQRRQGIHNVSQAVAKQNDALDALFELQTPTDKATFNKMIASMGVSVPNDLEAIPGSLQLARWGEQLDGLLSKPVTLTGLAPWLLSLPSPVKLVGVMIGVGGLSLAAAYIAYAVILAPFFSVATFNESATAAAPVVTGATALPAVAEELTVTGPNGEVTLLPLGTSLKVLKKARSSVAPTLSFGRQDPFAPLVNPDAPPVVDDVPVIVESPVDYVGIIKDTLNTRNPHHVAMLQIKGDERGRTLIKEAGEFFEVDGQPAQVAEITPQAVTLLLDEQEITLPLKTYAEVAADTVDSPVSPPSNSSRGSRRRTR